jgi:adenylate cyclase
MLEIERKFLMNEIPENLESCEKQEILQWYFKENKKNIRVRKTISHKKGRKYTTYTMTKKQGNWLIRQEDEKKISEKQFWDYREFAKNYHIKKTRYFYHYDKYVIEINQFHNTLDGLRMAEIEFWSKEESEKCIPPSRCNIEVTEKKEANNSYLAVYGMQKLIKKLNFKIS